MEIVFWGTRGSYPMPGPTTLKYGGNTACVSVRAGNRLAILDAGTGIINLGRKLADNAAKKNDISLFLSHNHLDHTSGLLYFIPTYQTSTFMRIYGPADSQGDVAHALNEISLPPNHPVAIANMGMDFTCTTLENGQVLRWRPDDDQPELVDGNAPVAPEDVVMRVARNPNHPVDGVLTFRLEHLGKSFVYATDIEGDLEKGDPGLAEFAANADLLAHDCQYTTEDYLAKHRGWGHSTPEMAVKTAAMAGVKRLALIHFEPTYDDDKLSAMEANTKRLFPDSFFAREGLKVLI